MPSVTRRPRQPRAQRRDEVEGAMLDATERLLADGATFTELSVERLIREGGMSRGTFYSYFDDKADLIGRLAARVIGELETAAAVWWDRAENRRREDLREAIESILEAYLRHERIYRALIETASYDTGVAAAYRGLIDGLTESAVGVIERGQAAGLMRRGPPRETAGALTWMVERAAYQLLDGAEAVDRDRLVEALTNLIWFGLYEDV